MQLIERELRCDPSGQEEDGVGDVCVEKLLLVTRHLGFAAHLLDDAEDGVEGVAGGVDDDWAK